MPAELLIVSNLPHREWMLFTHVYASPQIVLLATVAYASAGLYSGYGGLYGYGGYGYGGGYGLGHGVAAIAPPISYAHGPVATSYANTYKVSSFNLQRALQRGKDYRPHTPLRR